MRALRLTMNRKTHRPDLMSTGTYTLLCGVPFQQLGGVTFRPLRGMSFRPQSTSSKMPTYQLLRCCKDTSRTEANKQKRSGYFSHTQPQVQSVSEPNKSVSEPNSTGALIKPTWAEVMHRSCTSIIIEWTLDKAGACPEHPCSGTCP